PRARNVQRETKVLAGLVVNYRPAIGRNQHEGANDAAFVVDTLDDKVTPAVPSPWLIGEFPVDRGFTSNQDLGEEPVGFTPGGQDFGRRCVAQYVPDRAEQRVGHERIMFRT